MRKSQIVLHVETWFTEFARYAIADKTSFKLSHREFVKIFDGNGTEVFSLHGSVSSFDKNVREISFGDSKNITIQVSLIYSWSYVKIDYSTLNQGLDSGKKDKKKKKKKPGYILDYGVKGKATAYQEKKKNIEK